MHLCDFKDCGRPVKAKKLCFTHYWQQRRGETLRPITGKGGKPRRNAPCDFKDCGRHAIAKGLCAGHRKQELRGLPLVPLRVGKGVVKCAESSCPRRSKIRGYCDSHYAQLRLGKPLRPLHTPTGRWGAPGGYIRLNLPDHPNAGKNGTVMEHHKVMSDAIGRPLFPDETVHHKNGVKDDNRLSNLELWSSRHPKGQRVEDKIEFAIEMLRRYAPERLSNAEDRGDSLLPV